MPAPQNSHASLWEKYGLICSLLVCAGINAAILAGIAHWNWPYLVDERQISNPDASHYILLGKNLLEHGTFSRCSESPFVPDILRTPGFPLLIAATWKLGGVAAIFIVTASLHVVNCWLVYLLTKQLYGVAAAVCASAMLATDLMIASYNFSAMAENPFLTPLLVALVFFVAYVLNEPNAAGIPRSLVAGSLALGIATLIRPTSLYLGGLIGLYMFAFLAWQGRFRKGLLAGATILLVSLLPVLPWIARNYASFGVPKLTTVDTNNLVYFVGAGGFQLARNVTLVEAQRQIADEYSLPTYETAQNSWTSDLSPAEIEHQLSAAAPKVLLRYPLQLVEACILGTAKATISHSVEFVAELFDMNWNRPGFTSLIRGDSAAWRRLAENNPILLAIFGWQMLHVLAAIATGVVGAIAAWRFRSARIATLLLLMVLGYLYAIIAMFGLDAFYRCRIPAMPVLYVFSGVGLAKLLSLLPSDCQPAPTA